MNYHPGLAKAEPAKLKQITGGRIPAGFSALLVPPLCNLALRAKSNFKNCLCEPVGSVDPWCHRINLLLLPVSFWISDSFWFFCSLDLPAPAASFALNKGLVFETPASLSSCIWVLFYKIEGYRRSDEVELCLNFLMCRHFKHLKMCTWT